MDEISISEISTRFEEHLNLENNMRIVFSGKFGVGKTFFLNRFFDERISTYNKFIISPASYVVNSNEDIFELIKADIIKDLFFTGKIKEKKKAKKSKFEKVDMFIGEKPQHLIKFITSSLKKVNPFFEIVDDFHDGLKKLIGEFKKYEKDLEDTLETSEETLSNFLNSFTDTKGNLFEHDFITKTINHMLTELSNEGEKKNVLIIDDLDRIDPDHIFRILNILSVHNNNFGSENKFQFDHVIVVCDIDNIKRIFLHRYGQDVDFEGYLDKFYSTEYFSFSNVDAVNYYIDSFSSEFESDEEKCFVKLVYQSLSQQNTLTLRKLLKHKIKLTIPDTSLFKLPHIQWDVARRTLELTTKDIRILAILKMLHVSLGSLNVLVEKMQDEKKRPSLASIDDKTFEAAFKYLALQFHLVKYQDSNLFFTSRPLQNQFGQTINETEKVSPIVSLNNESYSFEIQIDYDRENLQYLFEGATVLYNEAPPGGFHTTMHGGQFWDAFLTTIRRAKSKKYLEKAGVFF